MEKPNVWLDPDLCTGGGNCGKIAPGIFRLMESGVSAVHINGQESKQEGGTSGRTLQADEVEDALKAAAECPGEIIVVELE